MAMHMQSHCSVPLLVSALLDNTSRVHPYPFPAAPSLSLLDIRGTQADKASEQKLRKRYSKAIIADMELEAYRAVLLRSVHSTDKPGMPQRMRTHFLLVDDTT
jgi:hypothetical protein